MEGSAQQEQQKPVVVEGHRFIGMKPDDPFGDPHKGGTAALPHGGAIFPPPAK